MTANGTDSTGSQGGLRSRTSVLIHPNLAQGGRFLVLPHPRTGIPTYYLHSSHANASASTAGTDATSADGELFELSTIKDTRYDRSWMVSGVNTVVSAGQLEVLSRVDVRFLVISLLYSALGDRKFRSLEDTFEQISLGLFAKRSDEAVEAVAALKAASTEAKDADASREWSDILTFGSLPLVYTALTQVADVQDLPGGEKAFRLSLSKVYAILDAKHARLSMRSTFAAAPNTLGRSFERRWPLDSDPSAYLTDTPGTDSDEPKEATQLRRTLAAEIIATNLPPALAAEYCTHLGIASAT